MANRNFPNSRIYSGHVMPVLIDCNFVVDSSSGSGISSLKGPYVSNVFMHTSGSPSSGNPNPSAGTIVVQLQDNFNRLFSGFKGIIQSPNSGSAVKIDNSAMTAGDPYVITVLGDASLAKWQAIGVPAGVTPAVGVSFIAASNGGAGNVLTSRVQAPAAAGSGIQSIEIVGSPNLSISPAPNLQSYGASIILQCRDASGAIAAPVDGSLISLSFYLSNSSVTVAGE